MVVAGALGFPVGLIAAVLNRRRGGFFVRVVALLLGWAAARLRAWDARDAIDVMRSGRTYDGCSALETACEKACDPRLVPDLGGAVSECFELRIGAAEESEEGAGLDALARTALPLTAEERARLRE